MNNLEQLDKKSQFKRFPEAPLYIHIPFCEKLCSYCDFNKTARFDEQVVKEFFQALKRNLQEWIQLLSIESIPSLFLGGGTPGLFAKEYIEVFEVLKPLFTEDCEISIELNPQNVTAENMEIWKSLGINRFSLGVQTLDPQGLKVLGRNHSHIESRKALALLYKEAANFSIDLIYGWPGQTVDQFQKDLALVEEFNLPHISLYDLTYASQTPLGRAFHRGKVRAVSESVNVELYQVANRFLKGLGLEHEEVSNWSKPGYTCKHNWVYWENKYFLGLGPGAHGFLPSKDESHGVRYHYKNSHIHYSRQKNCLERIEIEDREAVDYMLEALGCGLRHKKGLDLERVKSSSSYVCVKEALPSSAFVNKELKLENQILSLAEDQWFKEMSWCAAVMDAFISQKSPAEKNLSL